MEPPVYPLPFAEPGFWCCLISLGIAIAGSYIAERLHIRIPFAGARWFVVALWTGIAARLTHLLSWVTDVSPSVMMVVSYAGPIIVYGCIVCGLLSFLRGVERVLEEEQKKCSKDSTAH